MILRRSEIFEGVSNRCLSLQFVLFFIFLKTERLPNCTSVQFFTPSKANTADIANNKYDIYRSAVFRFNAKTYFELFDKNPLVSIPEVIVINGTVHVKTQCVQTVFVMQLIRPAVWSIDALKIKWLLHTTDLSTR